MSYYGRENIGERASFCAKTLTINLSIFKRRNDTFASWFHSVRLHDLFVVGLNEMLVKGSALRIRKNFTYHLSFTLFPQKAGTDFIAGEWSDCRLLDLFFWFITSRFSAASSTLVYFTRSWTADLVELRLWLIAQDVRSIQFFICMIFRR